MHGCKAVGFSENSSLLSVPSCRHGPWREPFNPYYVNTGYAMAPATSANDSEQQSMSSDADTLSLTDSSVYVNTHTYTQSHPHKYTSIEL